MIAVITNMILCYPMRVGHLIVFEIEDLFVVAQRGRRSFFAACNLRLRYVRPK